MQDRLIINGLNTDNGQRAQFEKELYQQYTYFIDKGCKKYKISYEDGFSAYSDAVLSTIHNIINGRFDNQVSLKTYLFSIFNHKCVDFYRKTTTNKERANHAPVTTDLLFYMPDGAKNAIEKLISKEKIALIKQYLDVIGEMCKEILLLHEDGYSDREISEQLAYNNAAVVKTTRLRCREKIKNLLRNHA